MLLTSRSTQGFNSISARARQHFSPSNSTTPVRLRRGGEENQKERHINGSEIEEDSACCNLRSLMEFRGFPNEPAADIALKTVKSWVDENPDMGA
ncbi:hypothetical protein NQZ68_022981 [Dissostichus eleginoides]|nr:hypothetical protein NQZ68_022981 [Dissostichus eleginoides]